MSAKCLNKLILKQHICILNRGVNLKLYNISSFEIFSSKCVKKLNFKSMSSVLKFRHCRYVIASCQIDRARICQIKGLLFKVQILPYSLLLLHGPAFVSGFWNGRDSVQNSDGQESCCTHTPYIWGLHIIAKLIIKAHLLPFLVIRLDDIRWKIFPLCF